MSNLPAQSPTIERNAVGVSPAIDTSRPRRTISKTPGNRFVARMTLGSLAYLGGGFVGGMLGVAILGRDCGGCDDPGLASFLHGGTVGAIAGTGLAVGSIVMGDGCTRGSRTGRALFGAAIGTMSGMVIATTGGVDWRGDLVSGLSVPIIALVGSSYMAGTCRGALTRQESY